MSTYPPPEIKKPVIVVIDGSKISRTILKTGLGRENYDVRVFIDPVAALQSILIDQTLAPDVLILDFRLPNMHGDDVIRRLRRARKHLPIIVYTGQTNPLTRFRARLAGANAFLAKPAEMKDIVALVKRYAPPPPPQ